MARRLPDGLVRSPSSPVFTEDTLPAALKREHALAPGRWAVLNVLEGALTFVDVETSRAETLEAPDRAIIEPQARHRVQLAGAVRCRIDFYREPEDR